MNIIVISSPSRGSGGHIGGHNDGTHGSDGPAGVAVGTQGVRPQHWLPSGPNNVGGRSGLASGRPSWRRDEAKESQSCPTLPRRSLRHPPAPCSVCSAEGGWPEEPWLSALPWPPPENGGTQYEMGFPWEAEGTGG